MKACLQCNCNSVPEKINLLQCSNRMRNLHKFILENNRIEALRLLWDWERLQYRECDYINHRIFTIRCLHSDLVPVRIKLKSTLRTERARKILRSVEKQLIQARLRSINSLLDNNAKQLELTRAKIASILSNTSYRKCQEFIEKVKELRFNKVKDRQVRKFNNLLSKKEGNITWQSSQVTPTTRASPEAANRQASPATRATISSQVGRQASQATEASPQVALNSQAGSQVTIRATPQASQADSTLSQAESTVFQPFLADSTLSQAESEVSQAGIPQAIPTVRHSVRLRALHASQNNNSQAGSSGNNSQAGSSGNNSQAGNTPRQTVLSLSWIARPPRWVPPRLVFPRWLAVLVPRIQGIPIFPIGITVPMVLPPGRNLTQSG